jgi:hypothetical protein
VRQRPAKTAQPTACRGCSWPGGSPPPRRSGIGTNMHFAGGEPPGTRHSAG